MQHDASMQNIPDAGSLEVDGARKLESTRKFTPGTQGSTASPANAASRNALGNIYQTSLDSLKVPIRTVAVE